MANLTESNFPIATESSVGSIELATETETLARTNSTKSVTPASLVNLIPTGLLSPFAGSTAPISWLLCDGLAVSRSTYAVLFGVISTTYGVGDGSTTFNIPDLRGRSPIGVNDSGLDNGENGSYSTRTLAATVGAETHSLSGAELAAHTHTTANHNHTIAQHSHTVTSHTHTGPSHVHTMPSHTHTLSHTHAIDPPNTTSSGVSTGSTGTQSANHSHSMQSHTHAHDHPSTGSGSQSASHYHVISSGGYPLASYAITGTGGGWPGFVGSGINPKSNFIYNSANQSASHTHSTNLANKTSGGPSSSSTGTISASHSHTMAHTHTTNIGSFTSGGASTTTTSNVDPGNTNAGGTAVTGGTAPGTDTQGATSTGDDNTTTNSTGSGTAHQNMQPSIVMNYIIKT